MVLVCWRISTDDNLFDIFGWLKLFQLVINQDLGSWHALNRGPSIIIAAVIVPSYFVKCLYFPFCRLIFRLIQLVVNKFVHQEHFCFIFVMFLRFAQRFRALLRWLFSLNLRLLCVVIWIFLYILLFFVFVMGWLFLFFWAYPFVSVAGFSFPSVKSLLFTSSDDGSPMSHSAPFSGLIVFWISPKLFWTRCEHNASSWHSVDRSI